MKDKKRKIKEIAHKIVELEKLLYSGNTDFVKRKEYITQMERLTENLSLGELLEIDEYILENQLLKK